jgi:acetoin:2,6-dichlorophenolindophenol oxidoreductase subunit beta
MKQESMAQETDVVNKGKVISYREAIYQSMYSALDENPNTIIMGQGVDDHKGTFGTTSGLSNKFGNKRVFDIPLSEEGTTGIAVGAALNGIYPIQTHIRADFSLLAMNQIINLAAKYKYMYGGAFEVPMLIRLIIGRSWGQGAQHSQSLQSLFAHIPGLIVIMPSSADAVLASYNYAIKNHAGPVVSLEHRLLYDLNFNSNYQGQSRKEDLTSSKIIKKGSGLTIVATSIMVLEAQRAAEYLAKEAGIDSEIIDLHSISHYNKELILESVSRTGKLLIADTSWQAYGVCAEITRVICEYNPAILKFPVITMGMQPAPCPTSKILEDLYYPSLRALTDNIAFLVTGKKNHGIKLPDEKSMTEGYKKFKGPF